MPPRSLFLLVLILCWPERAASQPDSANVPAKNRELVTLIDLFLNQPLGKADVARAILDSAIDRNDVVVTVSTSVAPWICEKNPTGERRMINAVLLAAFTAGDARAQLVSGRRKDQPEAGLKAVVGVYRQLRERIPTYSVPQLDTWVQLDSAGVLHAAVDSIVKHPPKKCGN